MTYNTLLISAAECVNTLCYTFIVQGILEIRNVSDFLAKLQLNFDRVNMSHRQFCKKNIWNVPIFLSMLIITHDINYDKDDQIKLQ